MAAAAAAAVAVAVVDVDVDDGRLLLINIEAFIAVGGIKIDAQVGFGVEHSAHTKLLGRERHSSNRVAMS